MRVSPTLSHTLHDVGAPHHRTCHAMTYVVNPESGTDAHTHTRQPHIGRQMKHGAATTDLRHTRLYSGDTLLYRQSSLLPLWVWPRTRNDDTGRSSGEKECKAVRPSFSPRGYPSPWITSLRPTQALLSRLLYPHSLHGKRLITLSDTNKWWVRRRPIVQILSRTNLWMDVRQPFPAHAYTYAYTPMPVPASEPSFAPASAPEPHAVESSAIASHLLGTWPREHVEPR